VTDIWEEEALRQQAAAEAEDMDPRVLARRKALVQRDIERGVRDADGNYVVPDEYTEDEPED